MQFRDVQCGQESFVLRIGLSDCGRHVRARKPSWNECAENEHPQSSQRSARNSQEWCEEAANVYAFGGSACAEHQEPGIILGGQSRSARIFQICIEKAFTFKEINCFRLLFHSILAIQIKCLRHKCTIYSLLGLCANICGPNGKLYFFHHFPIPFLYGFFVKFFFQIYGRRSRISWNFKIHKYRHHADSAKFKAKHILCWMRILYFSSNFPVKIY